MSWVANYWPATYWADDYWQDVSVSLVVQDAFHVCASEIANTEDVIFESGDVVWQDEDVLFGGHFYSTPISIVRDVGIGIQNAFVHQISGRPALFLDRIIAISDSYLSELSKRPVLEATRSWLIISDSYLSHFIGKPDLEFSGGMLETNDSFLSEFVVKPPLAGIPVGLVVRDSFQSFLVYYPTPSTGGGIFDNTEHISYSGQDYLRCRHLFGNLTGTYTSPVFDIGAGEAANRHLIYVIGEDPAETDIVIVGEGTTWDDKMPSPTKWSEVGVSTQTWSEIFDLPGAPSVRMRMYYGNTNPPTSYVDRMEILSAIIPAGNQYFRLKITITDPNINVYAYVEAFTMKFCTYG